MTNNLFSKNIIINKYLSKLNQNKLGTFNFKNDASFLKLSKNKKLIITNDTILENIDFFQNDPPESIANKITTCNLSDISAMGAYPYAYTLSLSLPKQHCQLDVPSWDCQWPGRLLQLRHLLSRILILFFQCRMALFHCASPYGRTKNEGLRGSTGFNLGRQGS